VLDTVLWLRVKTHLPKDVKAFDLPMLEIRAFTTARMISIFLVHRGGGREGLRGARHPPISY
jgi:hypothetical protein